MTNYTVDTLKSLRNLIVTDGETCYVHEDGSLWLRFEGDWVQIAEAWLRN